MRWIPLTVFGTLACLGVTLAAQSPATSKVGTARRAVRSRIAAQ